MPQRTWCSMCDYLLYEGDILKSGADIIKKYDGKCPLCDKKLEYPYHEAKIYGDIDSNDEGIPKKALHRHTEREKAGSMKLYNNNVKRRWKRQKKRQPEE